MPTFHVVCMFEGRKPRTEVVEAADRDLAVLALRKKHGEALVKASAVRTQEEQDQHNADVLATPVRQDHNSHCVCVFDRGPKITHYVAVEGGPCLKTCKMNNDEFDWKYERIPERADYSKYTALDFALNYTRDKAARSMIPIAPSALRVLTAIMRGQQVGADETTLNQLENIMAAAKAEDTGFRKPDGPVAQIHKFLDSKLERVKAGTVSRKELVDALIAKDYAQGTVLTQAGVWARNNGVSFARPAAAAETKKASKKKAAA